MNLYEAIRKARNEHKGDYNVCIVTEVSSKEEFMHLVDAVSSLPRDTRYAASWEDLPESDVFYFYPNDPEGFYGHHPLKRLEDSGKVSTIIHFSILSKRQKLHGMVRNFR